MKNDNDKNAYMTHGEILFELRKDRGMSQQDVSDTLADKDIEISKQTISNYENDDNTSDKHYDKLKALFDFYGVPLWLVEFKKFSRIEDIEDYLKGIQGDKELEREARLALKQTLDNGLATPFVNDFKVLVKKYKVADFVSTDIPLSPFPQSLMEEVFVFNFSLKDLLYNYQTEQDKAFSDILRFGDCTEAYLYYLGEKTSFENNVLVANPHFIKDKEEIHRKGIVYRTELDKIYNEITNGGTLFIA